jgi:beta-phosphoglucomutase
MESKHTASAFKAVLFDMDGVLVASGPAHLQSWKMLARRHGVELTAETFRQTFGRTSRDIIRMLWGEHVSDQQVRAIDEEKEAIYRELITGMVPLTIGVRETLHSLREAGLRLAVVSSGPRANIDLVLSETRIGPFFEQIVSGEDIRAGKPDPECYLLAAERLGVRPAECAAVEDAPVGIAAAQAAGMRTIAFVGTYEQHALEELGADMIVSSLRMIRPDTLARLK